MIKVIKKKNKTRCRECKSILRFEQEDVIQKKYSDGDWRGCYVKCPVCGYEAPLGEK